MTVGYAEFAYMDRRGRVYTSNEGRICPNDSMHIGRARYTEDDLRCAACTNTINPGDFILIAPQVTTPLAERSVVHLECVKKLIAAVPSIMREQWEGIRSQYVEEAE